MLLLWYFTEYTCILLEPWNGDAGWPLNGLFLRLAAIALDFQSRTPSGMPRLFAEV